MYNDKLVYMVVICVCFWVILWKEKETLKRFKVASYMDGYIYLLMELVYILAYLRGQ